MIALLWFFLTLFASPFKSKSRLEVENAVLRHQLIAVSASNLCSGPTHWRCCGHSRESCRWNRPPFRPRIARTMPHLGQCGAIATGGNMPIHL